MALTRAQKRLLMKRIEKLVQEQDVQSIRDMISIPDAQLVVILEADRAAQRAELDNRIMVLNAAIAANQNDLASTTAARAELDETN